MTRTKRVSLLAVAGLAAGAAGWMVGGPRRQAVASSPSHEAARVAAEHGIDPSQVNMPGKPERRAHAHIMRMVAERQEHIRLHPELEEHEERGQR